MRKRKYNTAIIESEIKTDMKPHKSEWFKSGKVLKTMMHRYRIGGKRGDIIDVNPDLYDELVKNNFLEPI